METNLEIDTLNNWSTVGAAAALTGAAMVGSVGLAYATVLTVGYIAKQVNTFGSYIGEQANTFGAYIVEQVNTLTGNTSAFPTVNEGMVRIIVFVSGAWLTALHGCIAVYTGRQVYDMIYGRISKADTCLHIGQLFCSSLAASAFTASACFGTVMMISSATDRILDSRSFE